MVYLFGNSVTALAKVMEMQTILLAIVFLLAFPKNCTPKHHIHPFIRYRQHLYQSGLHYVVAI